MQFSWWTFALQVINFLILAWLLQHFLYKPVRQVLDKRRALVDDKLKDAEEARKAADAEKEHLDNARADFDAEREKRMADLHQELAAEKEKLLADARGEAEKIIGGARQRMESERAEALESLKTEIAGLAADMAAKTLAERPRDAATALQRFKGMISGLTEDDLRKLRRGRRENGAPVEIVTAVPLAPAEETGWKDEISALIGAGADVAFMVDKDLIGGAEIRFPQAAVKLSLAGALSDLREGMLSK